MKEIIYVHAGDYSEFVKYQSEHPELTCIFITDGIFLRGRTPATIKVLSGHFRKWDSGEILESIQIHTELWKPFLEEEEEVDKIKGEDIYGV